VPPGDEIDGRLDILDAGAEDPVVPVRMGRVSIREPFLVIGQSLSEQPAVGDGKRPGIERPPQPPPHEQHVELTQWQLLHRGDVGPAQRRLE
jgi:hypothetical protein